MNFLRPGAWFLLLVAGALGAAPAANIPPSVIGPTSRTAIEDTPTPFTGADTVSVVDPDATGATTFSTTITSINGTATVSPTTGLVFTSGANGSATMTFSSKLVNLNNALPGLIYTSASNYVGAAQLSVMVSDGEDTGARTILVSVSAVNDPPSVVVPGTQTATEDTPFSLTGANRLNVGDVDATNLSVTLSVAAGTMTLGGGTSGLTFTAGANGTATMTFNGSIASLQTALSSVVFTPAANSTTPTTLTLSANDNGQSGTGGSQQASANVTINLQPVNDAPIVAAPTSRSATEDTALSFTAGNAISVSDIDAIGGATFTTTITVTNGAVTVSPTTGLTFTSGANGSATMTFDASLPNLNNALAGLNFLPATNFSGSAQLVLGVADNGASGTGGSQVGSAIVPISVSAVNDPPVLSAPATVSVGEDEASPLSGFGVADPDATSLQLTLTVPAGTLTAAPSAPITISGSGSAALVLSGSSAALNTYLATPALAYLSAANAGGTVTLNATLSDLGSSGSGGTLTDTKSVTLSIAPRPDADLVLTLSNTKAFFAGGTTVHYQLIVRNNGVETVSGNSLNFVVSGNLGNLVWACAATAASCPAAAGNGTLAFNAIALPVGGILQFLIDADVAAIPETSAIATGTLTPPATLQDPTPGDHTATHTAAVGIFRAGFE